MGNLKINKILMGNLSQEERKYILITHNNYLKITSINNYEEVENNIYKKGNAEDISSKINIEIKRIKNYIQNNEISKENESLFSYILSLNSIEDDENIDKTYLYKIQEEIIKYIIELEVKLNMKIYLYKEFVNYYNEIIDEYYDEELIDENTNQKYL